MSIRIPESDLIALLGEHNEHWVQGSWEDTDAMCLHGAICRCSPIKGDAFLIEQVADRKGWGTDWNDDNQTTWADVRARLAQVEVTDVDLADTFGPQWEAIVALVRRAGVLTADEAKQSAAAWAAAWDAADAAAWAAAGAAKCAAARAVTRAATQAAARAAARDAAQAAAWATTLAATGATAEDAAWDHAGAAAASAAEDAALALVLRDLIGQHGFTQAHYDTLTRPWAAAFGPVHPDDVRP